ncbi:MAG: hypothetical protein ACLR23_18960 [Clostridia bacterium]
MAGQSTDYSPVPMVNDIAFFGVHVISALASNIEDPEAQNLHEQRWDDVSIAGSRLRRAGF